MTLTWVHTKAMTVELFRYPSFSIPTLLFPAASFIAFGSRQPASADLLMAFYAAFALLGVAFFQFGVGIAAERTSAWQVFLRILPAPSHVRFAARVASALAFGLASAAGVVLLAVFTEPVELAPGRWPVLLATLVVGGAPFALLGISIGYWLTPRGALPAANLVFLALSYVGGLLTASRHLPGLLGEISPYMPTRLWGGLLAASVDEGHWRLADAAGLLAYGVLFALLAAWGYRRDEGERFR